MESPRHRVRSEAKAQFDVNDGRWRGVGVVIFSGGMGERRGCEGVYILF